MAADFTANSSKIDVGTFNIGAVSQMTLGLWVFIDAFGGGHGTDARFFSKASSTSTPDHDVMLGQVLITTQRWRIRFNAGGTTETFVSTEIMNSGQWYSALVTYNDPRLRLYVDGVLTSIDTDHTVGGNIPASAKQIFIGNNEGDQLRAPNGAIAEVFWTSELFDLTEIKQHASGKSVKRIHSHKLDAYWPLTPDCVGPTQDVSGNARNGTSTTIGHREHPPVERFRPPRQLRWPFKATVAVGNEGAAMYHHMQNLGVYA